MMIALVLLEVLAEVVDPLSEEGDLDGGAAPVRTVELVLLDEILTIYVLNARHRPARCLPAWVLKACKQLLAVEATPKTYGEQPRRSLLPDKKSGGSEADVTGGTCGSPVRSV